MSDDTEKALTKLVIQAMGYSDIPGQLRAINLLGACTKTKWASVVRAVHKKHGDDIDEGISRLAKWGTVAPSAAAVKDIIAKVLQSNDIAPYPELIWGLTPKEYQTEIACKEKVEVKANNEEMMKDALEKAREIIDQQYGGDLVKAIEAIKSEKEPIAEPEPVTAGMAGDFAKGAVGAAALIALLAIAYGVPESDIKSNPDQFIQKLDKAVEFGGRIPVREEAPSSSTIFETNPSNAPEVIPGKEIN